MDPAESFRLSVAERLEAAAEEIFLLFRRSVAQYEEEIERQRRQLDVVWKPHVKLQRIGTRVHSRVGDARRWSLLSPIKLAC